MAAIRSGGSLALQAAACMRSPKVLVPCSHRLKSMLATAAAAEITNNTPHTTQNSSGLSPPPQCPMHGHLSNIQTSSSSLTSSSILGGVSSSAGISLQQSATKPFEEIPGPKGLPLLGTLLDYTSVGEYCSRCSLYLIFVCFFVFIPF